MGGHAQHWRIGTLAGRVGVSETLLRAWEKRYGLLSPTRSAGGYRLYGPEDERRALAMVDARQRSVPAGQAAAEILTTSRRGSPRERPAGQVPPGREADDDIDRALGELAAAMTAYDLPAMQRTIDQLLSRVSVEGAVRDVLLPFMRDVGAGWERGSFTVADEHFASDLVRSRLASLSLGAGSATGPMAVLACPSGERHDVALKAFELVLLRAGWRTRYLGADLPLDALTLATAVVEPDLVVLAATDPRAFAGEEEPPEICRRFEVALAGSGASAEAAERWGASHLSGDPVTAAQRLVGTHRVRPEG